MRSTWVAAGLAALACLAAPVLQAEELEGWKKLTDQRFEAIDAGETIGFTYDKDVIPLVNSIL